MPKVSSRHLACALVLFFVGVVVVVVVVGSGGGRGGIERRGRRKAAAVCGLSDMLESCPQAFSSCHLRAFPTKSSDEMEKNPKKKEKETDMGARRHHHYPAGLD